MKRPTKEQLRPTMPTKADIEKLADFRYQLRRYERISENIAREEGLTALQYVLLLQIRGYPGRDWATIGELAERLQAQHHGVVALISRCEQRGLVERRTSETDRRQVEVRLLPEGERCLARLARLHQAELAALQGRFAVPEIDLSKLEEPGDGGK